MFRKSPCTGYCTVDSKGSQKCIGCLRTMDEILNWGRYSSHRMDEVQRELPGRRARYDDDHGFIDQMGRKVTCKGPFDRIVSLVPSTTQTLYDLGLEPKVVGITAFCPTGSTAIPKVKVGGTKNIQMERLHQLQPQLVLGAKEENTKEAIEEIEKHFAVWMADTDTLDASLAMIEVLGELLETNGAAPALVNEIRGGLPRVAGLYEGTAAYLIWKKPYMCAARSTFIDSWLWHLGFRNIFGAQERYPETSLEELVSLGPDVLFLPNEPYNFSPKEQTELQDLLPQSRVLRVDGVPFTWQGSSMLRALSYFPTLDLDKNEK